MAAQDAAEVLLRIEKIRATDYPRDDFLGALVDCNSAVETAPMMFPGVYKANRDRLNELWNRRNA